MLETLINDFFYWCVYVLQVIGDVTGMGYQLANIVIFVFLQPALILLFFYLWIKEKRDAAYQIYAILHHTLDSDGKIPKIAELQTKFKLRKYFNE